jgi:hypothetical protein
VAGRLICDEFVARSSVLTVEATVCPHWSSRCRKLRFRMGLVSTVPVPIPHFDPKFELEHVEADLLRAKEIPSVSL